MPSNELWIKDSANWLDAVFGGGAVQSLVKDVVSDVKKRTVCDEQKTWDKKNEFQGQAWTPVFR